MEIRLRHTGSAGVVAAVLGVKAVAKLRIVALLTVFAKKAGMLLFLPFLCRLVQKVISEKASPNLGHLRGNHG